MDLHIDGFNDSYLLKLTLHPGGTLSRTPGCLPQAIQGEDETSLPL